MRFLRPSGQDVCESGNHKQYIRGIRKALGDDPEKPTYIENFQTGYQFIAPVSDEVRPVPRAQLKRIVGRKTRLLSLAPVSPAPCVASDNSLCHRRAGIGKRLSSTLFINSLLPPIENCSGQCVEGFGGKEAYYPCWRPGQLVRDSDGSRVAQTLGKRAPTWLSQFPL